MISKIFFENSKSFDDTWKTILVVDQASSRKVQPQHLRKPHQRLKTKPPTLIRMMFLRIHQHFISTEKEKRDQKLLSLKKLGRGTIFFQIYHMRGPKNVHCLSKGVKQFFLALREGFKSFVTSF